MPMCGLIISYHDGFDVTVLLYSCKVLEGSLLGLVAALPARKLSN